MTSRKFDFLLTRRPPIVTLLTTLVDCNTVITKSLLLPPPLGRDVIYGRPLSLKSQATIMKQV